MDTSFVIPTHNRARVLAQTLKKIGRLDVACIGTHAEVIVVDNASDEHCVLPSALDNGVRVIAIRMDKNLGSAARNIGVQRASADWVVMLDDDSSPLECPMRSTLNSMPDDVHAVGGEIFLPNGQREAGGLPEIVIGCGCAYRRDAFLHAGGYDESFDYYAEEYDLCARIMINSGRIVHHRGLRFEHRKSDQGRSFARIIHRLVRNNGWVLARYAPARALDAAMDAMIDRYRGIAEKEGVIPAFEDGLRELEESRSAQPRHEMNNALWDRFIGVDACRSYLGRSLRAGGTSVGLVDEGKAAHEIRTVIRSLNIDLSDRPSQADVRVAGTLSPGPMTDAIEREQGVLGSWEGFQGASG